MDKANILVADDEQGVRTAIEQILKAEAWDVRGVADGATAVRSFEEEPADLVLLDMRMPSMTGLEVCRALRATTGGASTPILIISGLEDEETILAALDAGADDYILKPFSRGHLLAKIRFALRRTRGRQTTKLGIRTGTRFANRFDINRELGAGGFSVVLDAYDHRLDRRVALKVFDLPAADTSILEHRKNFLREAFELSLLDCPGIVTFCDFGQSNVFLFLVMEYLEGETLKARLASRGAMTEAEACKVMRDLVVAVRCLAKHSILHRDIKPANIFMTATGQVKLIDFGLAATVMEATHMAHQQHQTFLSPIYAAPECFYEDVAPDISGDVYSLGATFFCCLCGEKPFSGPDPDTVLASKESRPAPRMRDVRPDLSDQTDYLLARMLSRKPHRRPTLDELEAFFAER